MAGQNFADDSQPKASALTLRAEEWPEELSFDFRRKPRS